MDRNPEFESAARKVTAFIHFLARGLPEADIEDLCQKVFAELWRVMGACVDAAVNDFEAMGVTIGRRRYIDRMRQLGRGRTVQVDSMNVFTADKKHTVDQNELRRSLTDALKAVTEPGSNDRRLVDLLLAAVADGQYPSMRELGREIWPNRPQTACENIGPIFGRAQAYLSDDQ